MRNKIATIKAALKRVVRDWRLRKVAGLRGTVVWEGDLMESRRD